MKGHYKPEDFRREKRRVDWGLLFAVGIPLAIAFLIGPVWFAVRTTSEINPKPPVENPKPAVSYETKRLLLDERRNLLLERLVKAVEAKPEVSTNALRTPLPGVAEQLGVSAETKRLVAELQGGGDSE